MTAGGADHTLRYRACPLCEAICGLELRYVGDRLSAIRGDAQDPFSRGHICPKGNAILDLEHDPDRLRTPQLRVGTRWHRIGWDEALHRAATGLAEVQARHGDAAVAAYLGNPNVHHLGHLAYVPALLRVLKTPNVYSASSVDQWPHQLVAAQMYGHMFLLPIVDLDHTDWLLMLGANPVASMGSLMTAPGVVKRLKALTARGRLVVVDPRRTETAALASQHLPIRPGGDAAFLIALVQALLRRGAPRVAAYAGHLQDLDLALHTLDAVPAAPLAALSGIDAATLESIADQLWASPRAAVYGRMGVSTQRWGSLCQWLIQLLNLITGNLDRIGGVLPNEAAIPLTGAGTSSGRRARWHSRVRGLPEFAGELPVAALSEEIRTPGPGQVRGVLTCAGNPVLSTPAGHQLDAALAGLEFMVSIDIYRNETTRHAHLILPPASFLSQPHYDLTFNALAIRRVARWNPPVQAEQPGEMADWRILSALGEQLARLRARPWQAPPSPSQWVQAGLKRGQSGLDFATLEAAQHGLDLGPLQPNLLRRLETPNGAIHCAPTLLLAELQRWCSDALRSASEAQPTLQLIGRRDIRSNNSWMHNAARLVKGPRRHQLQVHPDDLQRLDLQEGSRARLRSAHGEIEVELEADAGLRPGVVCLPHGYGHTLAGVQLGIASAQPGASYNDLTDPHALDAPTGNAALNGVTVQLEALAVS